MNRILKVVFSRAKGMFVVVSELGRACSKSGVKSVLVTVPMVLASSGVMAANVVLGDNATASGSWSTAVGEGATASGSWSTAFGHNAKATADRTLALGDGAVAKEDYSQAIGYSANAYGSQSVAVGNSSSYGNYSVSLGNFSQTGDYEYQTALGYMSNAREDYSVALGAYSDASDPFTVSVGGIGVWVDLDGDGTYEQEDLYRRIVNVADGTADHDAATVGQTKAALSSILGSDVTVSVDSTTGVFSYSLADADKGIGGTGKATVSEAIGYLSDSVDAVNEYFSINPTNTVKPWDTTSAKALGEYTLAIGPNALARGYHTLALGEDSLAEGRYSVALGYDSSATGAQSIALGYESSAAGSESVALGRESSAAGEASVALGFHNSAAGARAIALGSDSSATGSFSIALGPTSSAATHSSVALGFGSSAAGQFAIALGSDSSATGWESVALGYESVAKGTKTISVGHVVGDLRKDGVSTYVDDLFRRIVNVADGTADHDAATVGQVSVGLSSLNGILGSDFTYTNSNGKFSYGLTDEDSGIGGTGAKTISEAIRVAAASGSVNWDAIKAGTDTTAAEAIQAQAKSAVKVVAASDSPVTVTGVDGTYTVDVVADGQVASGNTGLVTGGTVYTALNQVSGAIDAVNEYISICPPGIFRYEADVTTSARALHSNAIAIGHQAKVGAEYSGDNSVALGYSSLVTGSDSIALGAESSALGYGTVALGYQSSATIMYATAVGWKALATGIGSVALGDDSQADGYASAALGRSSWAKGDDSVALGYYSTAAGKDSIALGYGSVASEDNTVSVGHVATDLMGSGNNAYGSNLYRRIVNVADGTADHDAATVGQTKAALGAILGSDFSVELDDEGKWSVKNGSGGTDEWTISDAIAELTTAGGGVDWNNLSPDAQGVIQAQAKAAVKVVAASDSPVRVTGADGTYTVNVVADGQVASGNTGLVTGGTVYTALNAVSNSISAVNEYFSINPTNSRKNQTEVTTSAKALGKHSLAIGDGATASGAWSTAVGGGATASGGWSTAVGDGATASGAWSTAFGFDAKATADRTLALGYGAEAIVDSAQAIGRNARAFGSGSVAVGESSSYGNYSVSLGNHSQTHDASEYQTALGYMSNAREDYSVALGAYSEASDPFTVSVGGIGVWVDLDGDGTYEAEDLYRRIVNVANGRDDHDAATVGQLKTEVRLEEDGNYTLATNTAALNIAALDAKLYAALSTASGIDVAKWSETLGTGTVTSGNKGLVTGGVVYDAIQRIDAVDASAAKADASNVGSYAAQWGQALGTGAVQSGDGKLVTGDTVHTAINSAVANKLDNDLSSLSGTGQSVVASIAQSAVTVGDGNHTNVTVVTDASGNKTYQVNVKTDGEVVAGDTGIVTGGTVYEAIQSVKSETQAGLDNKLDKSTFDSYKTTNDQAVTNATNIANDASTKADAATTVANNALAEAGKHTSVSSSNQSVTIVESTNAQGGKNYDLSVSFDSLGSVSSGQGDKQIVMNGDEGTLKVGDTLTLDSTGKITGVAAGEISATSKDAVNGSQLYETQQMIGQNASNIQTLSNQVNKTYDKVQRVGAGAAALAALRPQDFSPEHPISGAVGLGHYDGKQAIAVGMYYRPTENFTVGFGASAAGSNDYMMNAGISYRFGGSGSQLRLSQSDINRKVVDLTDQNRALVAQLESANIRAEASAQRVDKMAGELAQLRKEMQEMKKVVQPKAKKVQPKKAQVKKVQVKQAQPQKAQVKQVQLQQAQPKDAQVINVSVSVQ